MARQLTDQILQTASGRSAQRDQFQEREKEAGSECSENCGDELCLTYSFSGRCDPRGCSDAGATTASDCDMRWYTNNDLITFVQYKQ
jgi:hypothetical protein